MNIPRIHIPVPFNRYLTVFGLGPAYLLDVSLSALSTKDKLVFFGYERNPRSTSRIRYVDRKSLGGDSNYLHLFEALYAIANVLMYSSKEVAQIHMDMLTSSNILKDVNIYEKPVEAISPVQLVPKAIIDDLIEAAKGINHE